MSKTGRTMFIERDMHRSPAFLELSKSATVILFELFSRRKLKQREGAWVITNNGQIKFSYREAKRKFGFFPSTMVRAITQLVEYGFIDIAHQGTVTSEDFSRYAISQRWREYGTNKFITHTRKKDTRKLGFASLKRKKIATACDSEQLAPAVVIQVPKTVANVQFKRNK